MPPAASLWDGREGRWKENCCRPPVPISVFVICWMLRTFGLWDGPEERTAVAFDAREADFRFKLLRPLGAGAVEGEAEAGFELRPGESAGGATQFAGDGIAEVGVSHCGQDTLVRCKLGGIPEVNSLFWAGSYLDR